MKKLFLMLVAAGLGLSATAQKTDKQVATLQHGDQTRVFYGSDAFIQAYEAAADTLDVITLSSGEFNTPGYIEKSITVYGAGFENDTITGIPRTAVEIYSIRANGVHLEGLYLNTDLSVGLNEDDYYGNAAEIVPNYNLSIVKCHLRTLWFRVDSYNCVIRQSYIYNFIGSLRAREKYYPSLGPQIVMHNFFVSNNFIQGTYISEVNNSLNNNMRSFKDFEPSSTIHVDHCILMGSRSMMEGPWHYTNNIINDFRTGGYCNIFFGNEMPSQDDNRNWINVSPEYVWAADGEDGTYAENKDFAIKLPELYIGTDGTQVGLYGGVYAWNKIPSTPRITECIINTNDVANGTLKVSIKAEAQTKE